MRYFSFLLSLTILFLAAPVGAEMKKPPLQRVKKLFEIKSTPSAPIDQPSDVVVNSRGTIYAVDGVNNRILVYDSNGSFLSSFGRQGKGKGELNLPVGIGISKNNHLYVADRGNRRIAIFNPEGKFIKNIDLSSKGVVPIDVVFDSSTDLLYITDNKGHRIVVFHISGKFATEWGQRGEEDEDFRYPTTLLLRNGSLFIADALNSRVSVYRANGAYVRQVGEWGVLPGKFFRPKGVAVDGKGKIYIADSYMDVIQVFSDEGRFLYLLGDDKGKTRKFTSPGGIFIKSNRLYVTEMLENKISVYALK